VIFATAHRHYRMRTGAQEAKGWPTAVHGALLSLQVAALSVLEMLDVLRS
jgi:hypothetical protein